MFRLKYTIPRNKINCNLRMNHKNLCYLWNKMASEETKNKKYAKNKYDYVELVFGKKARKLISEGIVEMSDTVGETYGPLGKNIAITEGKQPVIVTKDGVTVAKYIKFGSRKKNLGCRLLSSVAASTNVHAGDGTTTSTILASEIVK
jgi:chaperonin GroEL